jgi:type I restriction enzyme S subunit
VKADRLKKSILQTAVQGRLIAQNPADEPAKILLEKIRKERKRLIKEGKIKKDKTESVIYRAAKDDGGTGFFEKTADGKIRDITDELPFEIPESWEWARLGSIGTFIRGSGIKRSDVKQSGVQCVRYGEIYTTYNIAMDSAVSYIDEELSKYSKPIQYGDLLLSLTGETKEEIGKTVAFLGHEKTVIGGDIAAFTNHRQNPLYLSYMMNSPCAIAQKALLGTGDIIVHVSCDKLASIFAPLPPLAEQARIVKKIEELSPLFDEYDIAQRNLSEIDAAFPERLKKSILQTAVQGRLIAQNPADEPAKILLEKIRKVRKRLIKEGKIKKDKAESVIYRADKDDGGTGFFEKTADGKIRDITDELPFEIPDSWEWARLGEICLHNTGKTLDRGRNTGELREYITTSNLYWGRFELDEVRKMAIRESELEKCTAIKGDLLICEGGDAGRSAVWERETPICIQNHIHRLRFLCKVNAYYAYYYMMLVVLGGSIANYKKGVAIKSISSISLSNILFPLPPLAEQARIVKKIEELESLRRKLQKTLQSAMSS